MIRSHLAPIATNFIVCARVCICFVWSCLQWLCPKCVAKEETDKNGANGSAARPEAERASAGSPKSQTAPAEGGVAKKEADETAGARTKAELDEQQALRLAALAVLEEESEEYEKVGG